MQHYLVNTNRKIIQEFELPTKLFSGKITEFHFENGSQGCFHSNNARKIYKIKDAQFVVDTKSSTSKYLKGAKKEIK